MEDEERLLFPENGRRNGKISFFLKLRNGPVYSG